MTGQEVRDYIVRTLKRPDKDEEIYDALTDVVMEIRLLIASEKAKQEAWSDYITANGDYKLALPTDFGHILGEITAVDDETNETWVVKKISKEKYDLLYSDRLLADADQINKDKPVHFCIFAEQVYFGPVPDKITYQYQMNYTTEEATVITSATTMVPFSDRYRKALKYGVLAEVYNSMDLDEEAQKWQAYYDREIGRIADNDEANTNGGTSENAVYHGI